ncbi:MAG: hypothetical protein NTX05_00135, partial [Fusobacteria bacterium]|nr:hypothetical protein [Fusobacteriota bacterium]
MKSVLSIDFTNKNSLIRAGELLKKSDLGIEVSRIMPSEYSKIKKEFGTDHKEVSLISIDTFISTTNFVEENHYLKQFGVALDIGSQLKCENFLCELDLIAVNGEVPKLSSRVHENEIIKNSLELLSNIKRVSEIRKKKFFIFPLSILSSKTLFERVSELSEILDFIQARQIKIALEIKIDDLAEVEKILVTFSNKIGYIRIVEAKSIIESTFLSDYLSSIDFLSIKL